VENIKWAGPKKAILKFENWHEEAANLIIRTGFLKATAPANNTYDNHISIISDLNS
jgi:hypothetical protein